MIRLPQEIINKIFSYLREIPPTYELMKYVIQECYEEDFDTDADLYEEHEIDYYDNYCFQYSFYEWYFFYRKNYIRSKAKLNRNNKKYYHTPKIIHVGYDKLDPSNY